MGRHVLRIGLNLTREGVMWAAVLEAGPRAQLDGESVLERVGLRNYVVSRVRISVPRGAKIRARGTTVDIRQTRRWSRETQDPSDPLPRTLVEVAAIRAALWATSQRQATLLLTMVVQQRLASVEQLVIAMNQVRRDKRRTLIYGVLTDLDGGIQSLGELDLIRGLRDRGLPEPDKQVLRRTPQGNYYLDFRWRPYAVVVEVDGIQHGWVEKVVDDALRHNRIALEGDLVLRLPVIGLRLTPDDFYAQIEQALVSRGWKPNIAA